MKSFKKPFLTILLWLSMSPAYAAMVPTVQFTAEPERALLVSDMDRRQQVEQQLIALGVTPADAQERVRQMSSQQISSLPKHIADLPAGAAVSTTELLLIVILVILLL